MLGRGIFAFFMITSMLSPNSFADKRKTPKLVREYSSPSGEFHLVVTGREGWAKPHPSAQLFQISESGTSRSQVWRIDELPHRLGPGDVLISNSGVVVLIDEWVRTPSPVSLMVVGAVGKTIKVHSFNDIAQVTGKPKDSLIESAKVGIWQSRRPVISLDSERVQFFTGDTHFTLDLESGVISRDENE